MFTKIKSFISKQLTSDTLPLEDSLSGTTSEAKIPQCPFSQRSSNPQNKQQQKCPVTGKAVPNTEVDSDSEEEKPKGGCPFMGGTSDKKKNPSLNLSQEGFDEPFISKFRFYLSSNKLDFSKAKRGLPEPAHSRHIFDQLPIYLKHTLFYNGQDYKKVRNLECCSRFMAYEQLREKGNKFYNKGKFYEALEFYERAMSLFRWMEHQEPVNQSTVSEQMLPLEQSFDEVSQNGSKVNISLGNESVTGEDTTAAFEELKTKYKEFFVTYSDDNTKIFEGEEMDESADIDMRKSLLCQIYLNMAAAYIRVHHYSLAERVCNDGLELTDKVSQLYFRKAQALVLRKDCSPDQLTEAQKCIKIALEKRSTEKIFATANQNILKMLNIHDSAEAYEACRKFVEVRIEEVTAKNNENYSRLYERMKEIRKNELRIIEEGKVPQERKEEKVLRNTTEMKILSRMIFKYAKVIDFYTEAKNPEQVSLAKKEFQEVLRINHEVNTLFEVTLRQEDGELGGIETEKVQARLDHVKTAFAENIYNGGKFNFTMLEWAIKEIVKEEKQHEEEKRKQAQAEKEAQEGVQVAEKPNFTAKMPYMLILLPLLAILLSMFLL